MKMFTEHHLTMTVKNVLSYTSNPPYIFMAWCLTKHSVDFMVRYKHSRYVDCIVIFSRLLLHYSSSISFIVTQFV